MKGYAVLLPGKVNLWLYLLGESLLMLFVIDYFLQCKHNLTASLTTATTVLRECVSVGLFKHVIYKFTLFLFGATEE